MKNLKHFWIHGGACLTIAIIISLGTITPKGYTGTEDDNDQFPGDHHIEQTRTLY